jgi:hypothetical protein
MDPERPNGERLASRRNPHEAVYMDEDADRQQDQRIQNEREQLVNQIPNVPDDGSLPRVRRRAVGGLSRTTGPSGPSLRFLTLPLRARQTPPVQNTGTGLRFHPGYPSAGRRRRSRVGMLPPTTMHRRGRAAYFTASAIDTAHFSMASQSRKSPLSAFTCRIMNFSMKEILSGSRLPWKTATSRGRIRSTTG